MKNRLSSGSTIGIMGGGQLGRMLAMAAARLDFKTVIYDPASDCPAAQLANRHISASYESGAALEKFASACDIATYEFENVPVAAARLAAEKIPVFPPPEALDVAQDRLAEKIFLNSAGISTAPFASVDNDDDLAGGLERFKGRAVLKTRRFGYDGKGQRVFKDAAPQSAKGQYAAMGNVPLILEELIPFIAEVSVIAARGRDGAIAIYDPAENTHRNGILHQSRVPVSVPPRTEEWVQEIAAEILTALEYVGVIGVEFFVLEDGTALVNEIAPRVHNSGHWTEAACVVSQFEQHIRAVAGLPLGSTRRHSDCVMENLIGDDIRQVPELLMESNLVLHLYGKKESRPGRKMGHFTRITTR